MPNWCSHTATISHNDPSKIAELIQTFSDGNTFEHFIPLPNGDWDYDFCVEHWGTKWDIREPQFILDGPTMVDVAFATAWAPPIPVFEHMKQLGYTVKADYWDEGGFFVGIWNDGESRVFSPDNAPEDMAHLVAHFNYPEDDEPSDLEAEVEAESATHEAATNAQ